MIVALECAIRRHVSSLSYLLNGEVPRSVDNVLPSAGKDGDLIVSHFWRFMQGRRDL